MNPYSRIQGYSSTKTSELVELSHNLPILDARNPNKS